MKKLIIFLIILLTNFSSCVLAQQEEVADSTYKPVFYGKIDKDTIFGFSYEQTKDLMKDVHFAITADSIISAQDSMIIKLDSLQKVQKDQLELQKDLTKTCEDGQIILEEINKNQEEEIKEKDKKIKWYKIKLKIAPVLSAIATAAVFILLGN